jgi:hypothetical protein
MIPHTRPQLLVIWTLWFSMLVAVFIYQFTLGHGIPSGPNARPEGANPILFLAGGQLVVALVLRWILIPRADASGKMLVLMIIGLSLSESAEFFGLFLVPVDQPGTKLTLWILSIVSILQFAPVYALPKAKNPFHEANS